MTLLTITMKEAQKHEIINKLIDKKLSEEETMKSLGLKSKRQVSTSSLSLKIDNFIV